MTEASEHAEALATLLKETARAHHRAFIETDGYHPDWPLWYAEHLHGRLNDVLGSDLTVSELVHFLITVDRAHRAEAPDTSWPRYYAAYLTERYLAEMRP